MDIKRVAVVANGFLHDLATGCWLACIAAIALLHRFQAEQPEIAFPLGRIEQFFFWAALLLVVVMATGGVRACTYVDNFYGQDTERLRRRMLIAKHLVLFAIFAAGTWLSWTMAFH